jgi:hypothetical protein
VISEAMNTKVTERIKLYLMSNDAAPMTIQSIRNPNTES